MNFGVILTKVLTSLVLLVLLSFLLSWPVFMLWNGCLVGAVTGVATITWLQAWGINFLCALLFKSTLTVN